MIGRNGRNLAASRFPEGFDVIDGEVINGDLAEGDRRIATGSNKPTKRPQSVLVDFPRSQLVPFPCLPAIRERAKAKPLGRSGRKSLGLSTLKAPIANLDPDAIGDEASFIPALI